jgi:hypothetical protein
MPMVIITTVKAGCPSTGRNTMRSASMPTAAMTATANTMVAQYGQPIMTLAVSAKKAPSIIRSPWAKLTVSVAL